jgi:biopolymer transport protein ExbD
MRRRKNTTEEGGVDLGIIITPMLDMAFQLLAFFIITFHPATSEAAIDGTLLPAVNASASAGQREQLSVIVQAGQGGEPTAVYCKHNGNLKLLRLVKTPDDFALALQTLGDELGSRTSNSARSAGVRSDRSTGHLLTIDFDQRTHARAGVRFAGRGSCIGLGLASKRTR